jgi:hypothetical protein
MARSSSRAAARHLQSVINKREWRGDSTSHGSAPPGDDDPAPLQRREALEGVEGRSMNRVDDWHAKFRRE